MSHIRKFEVLGFKPVLTDNLSDGNCFYSAIYNAAKHQDILERIFDCLTIPVDDEKLFIKGARLLVSDGVESGMAKPFYEAYKDTFDSDIETLDLQIEAASSYIQKYISKKINEKKNKPQTEFYSYKDFIEELVKNIRKDRTWAGQIEVQVLKKIFSNCNIIIDFYSDSNKPKTLLPKSVDDKDYIYLHNDDSGLHFKHYRLTGIGEPTSLLRNVRNNIENSSWINNITRRMSRVTLRNSNNNNSNSNSNSNSNNIKKLARKLSKLRTRKH